MKRPPTSGCRLSAPKRASSLNRDVRSTFNMKIIYIVAACVIFLGCTDKNSLVTIDQQAISEIAANAIIKECPYLSPGDLPLLRVNYVYIDRQNAPLRDPALDTPTGTGQITATMLVKPTATVIRGVSSDDKAFSAYWYQEAEVVIRTNTAVRVRFLTQGREGGYQFPSHARILEGDELWAIVEAALRYMFVNNASAAQQNAPAYFVSLLRRDPPENFIRRFADVAIPVRTESDFKEGAGLKFFVTSITFLDNDTVSVEAGYYEGNMSASGNTLTLKRENEKWIVMSSRQDWIS